MSRYTVYITPQAWRETRDLPGHVRQRIRQAIRDLADSPRPAHGKRLDAPELGCELWRIRLDKWRIVCAITESDLLIDVLAVRRRPPYDYGDLERLLQEIE
jgi:mRNA interferase RelE/StbE